MSVVTICDWCGQQINPNAASGVYPQLSIAVQAPSPSVSPNLCSYDCAINWLANRKALDIANGYTLVSQATQPTQLTGTPNTNVVDPVSVASPVPVTNSTIAVGSTASVATPKV